MPIQPRQLLELAKSLICDDEVRNRSAASRAYYAAYHSCKPLADSLPDPPRQWKGSHERLILSMQYCPPRGKASPHKEIRAVGAKMALVKPLRTAADYECALAFTRVQAETTLAECEDIIDRVDVLNMASAPATQTSNP